MSDERITVCIQAENIRRDQVATLLDDFAAGKANTPTEDQVAKPCVTSDCYDGEVEAVARLASFITHAHHADPDDLRREWTSAVSEAIGHAVGPALQHQLEIALDAVRDRIEELLQPPVPAGTDVRATPPADVAAPKSTEDELVERVRDVVERSSGGYAKLSRFFEIQDRKTLRRLHSTGRLPPDLTYVPGRKGVAAIIRRSGIPWNAGEDTE